MKIAKLENKLEKVVKKEYGADGYLRIDRVEIYVELDKKFIVLNGAYGIQKPDGKVEWQRDYNLSYADGKSGEFICGMLYQFIDYQKIFGSADEEELTADGNEEVVVANYENTTKVEPDGSEII